MIYTHLAAAILGAAVAAAGAWQVQGWRLGSQIEELRAARALDTAEARRFEAARNRNVIEAQNAATKRAQAATAAAASAHGELDRLRSDLAASAGRASGESAASCTVRADTAGELLGSCAAEYLELASKADRIENDRRALIEAWPR